MHAKRRSPLVFELEHVVIMPGYKCCVLPAFYAHVESGRVATTKLPKNVCFFQGLTRKEMKHFV